MHVYLEQYESKFEEPLRIAFNAASKIYSELDNISIIMDSTAKVGVEVGKGIGEDIGKYKLSIKLYDDLRIIFQSFSIGLAMIIYDYHNGTTDFEKLSKQEKETFNNIYHEIHDKIYDEMSEENFY